MLSKNIEIGQDTTLESYSRVAMEDFGKNVLKKFGWKEPEKPDTRFLKDPKPRHLRLGLGAEPSKK